MSDIGDIKEYCRKNNVLIEALIVQHDALDKLFPNAVNTIRVMTYEGKCVGAVLRMGRGEAFVDNASSGGMFAPIDIEHGIVSSVASDYSSPLHWSVHPDTSTKIIGFEIPYWNDVMDMVEEASGSIRGIPLVGWDIAITKTGPVIVEVNAGPEIALLQVSGRDDLREILKL